MFVYFTRIHALLSTTNHWQYIQRPTSPPDLSIPALNTLRDSLLLFPAGSDDHLDTMEKLAKLHMARFEAAVQFPSKDLNEAIDLRREICRVCSPWSHRHYPAVHSFCEILQFRCYSQAPHDNFIPTGKFGQQDKDDLNELVALLEIALPKCPANQPLRLSLVIMLASALLRRGGLAGTQESVRLFRHALSLCVGNSMTRHLLLVNQSEALSRLVGASEKQETKAELEELVGIHREIVDCFVDSDEARLQALWEVGRWLERLCAPPLSCTDRFAELRSLAREILKLAPTDTTAHRYLAVAKMEAQNSHSDPPVRFYTIHHDCML